MRLTLNRDHVTFWKRICVAWIAFVAFGIVAGWRHGPRADEIALMLVLPLAIFIPYVALNLIVILVRALWPIRRHGRWSLRSLLIGRFTRNQTLRDKT